MFEGFKEDFNKKAGSYLVLASLLATTFNLQGCAFDQELRRSTYGVRQDMARQAADAVKCKMGQEQFCR